MATEARYGWELPDLGDVADGPFAFDEFAKDISDTIASTSISSYTPQWNSLGASQPGNTSAREGKYITRNGWCDFSIYLEFDGTTSGGTGQLYVTLPVVPSGAFKNFLFHTVLYTPGIGWWQGFASANSSANRCYPWFPLSNNPGLRFPWVNATDGNSPGTGTPRVDGSWAIQSGGWIQVTGRYYVG